MKFAKNILETIGNTPLVKINKLTAELNCLVLAKVETFNPITGTTKIAGNFRAYDITGYKTDQPHYAGIDQNGNVILTKTKRLNSE
jgi:threonine dehydratase